MKKLTNFVLLTALLTSLPAVGGAQSLVKVDGSGQTETLTLTEQKTDSLYFYTGEMTQAAKYQFTGFDAISSGKWDDAEDFFTRNSDGSFTFNAVTGKYRVEINVKLKFFKVYAVNDNGDRLTLKADGTGELWMRGNTKFGMPSYAVNPSNWQQGLAASHAFAQVSSKVYQMTLTVGKNIPTDDIDMKVYFQTTNGGAFIVNANASGESSESKVLKSYSYKKLDGSDMGVNKSGEQGIRYWTATNHIGLNNSSSPLTKGARYRLTYDVTNGTSAATLVIQQLESYTPVTVSAAGYATWYTTAAVDFSKVNGLKAYKAKYDKTAQLITLTPITSAPANTPVVLRGEAGDYFIPGSTDAAAVSGNDLQASTSDITTDGTQWILVKGANGVGFMPATSGETLKAGKCYLVINDATAAKAGFIGFNSGKTPTGIHPAQMTNRAEAPVYNLQGQRVNSSFRGIVIRNGKKYLNK